MGQSCWTVWRYWSNTLFGTTPFMLQLSLYPHITVCWQFIQSFNNFYNYWFIICWLYFHAIGCSLDLILIIYDINNQCHISRILQSDNISLLELILQKVPVFQDTLIDCDPHKCTDSKVCWLCKKKGWPLIFSFYPRYVTHFNNQPPLGLISFVETFHSA